MNADKKILVFLPVLFLLVFGLVFFMSAERNKAYAAGPYTITGTDVDVTVIDSTAKTCSIKEKSTSATSCIAKRKGTHIVIPKQIEYSGETYTIVELQSKAFTTNAKNGLKIVEFEAGSAITTIGTSAFDGGDGSDGKKGTLEEVRNIPTGVTSIVDYAFRNNQISSVDLSACTELTSFPSGFNLNPIETIGWPPNMTRIETSAFSGNTALTTITLPDGLESIAGFVFQDCINLRSVTMPNTVKAIYSSAFKGCTSLEEFTMPNSVTTLGGKLFEGCTALKTVTLSNSLTSLGQDFNGCTALETITIPASVTQISGTFDGCTNLKNVTLPSGLTTIGAKTFNGCTSLESITIPSTVRTIGNWAFNKCENLTEITVPSSVTSVGRKALGFSVTNPGTTGEVSEKIDGFVLRAAEGSAADRYAKDNKVPNMTVLEQRAAAVEEAVNNIGEVTVDSGALIAAARVAYDKALEADVDYGTNYAEINLPELKAALEYAEKLYQEKLLEKAKTELQQLIDEAEGFDLKLYTDESKTALTDAIQAAKDLLAETEITMEDVNAARVNLENAINGLEIRQVDDLTLAKEELAEEIANAKRLDSELLTDESREAFEAAIAAAEAVLADDTATLEIVQRAIEDLGDAMKELVYLADYRAAAIETINNRPVKPVADYYFYDHKLQIEEIIAEADAYINVTTDEAGIDAIVAAACAEIDKIKTMAQIVKDMIDALPNKEDVTIEDKDAIEGARGAYDALSDPNRQEVGEEAKKKLEEAEKALEDAIAKAKADEEAAAAVKELIDQIPDNPDDITLNDKDIVDDAKNGYDDLTDDQKKLISEEDKNKLDNAVDKINELEEQKKQQELEDKKQAAKDELDDILDNYDEPEKSDVEKKIQDAKDEIDKATTEEEVDQIVNDLKEEIKDTPTKDQKDKEAADAVKEKIDALPEKDKVTTDDEEKIKDARDAYDNLTDDQKKLIDDETLKKLEDAEKALDDAKKKAEEEAKKKAEEEARKKAEEEARKKAEEEAKKKAEENAPIPSEVSPSNPATLAAVTKAILNAKNDGDLKGSTYAPLKFQSKKQTKKSIKLQWGKVKGAKKYTIYANKCGTKNKYKKLATVKASKKSINIKKVAGKKLKKGTNYKFLIIAENGNKVYAISKTLHIRTAGSKKYANHKSVNIKKAVVNKAKKLKKGKTLKLKAKAVAPKGKRVSIHVKVRYESSNKKIATVTKAGKIKAKKKGTCYIYAYAQNGVAKRIKVRVK